MILVDRRETESRACLAAIFQALRTDPCDDREKLIQRKGSRADGTCQWITSNELYTSWLNARSGLLWISGGPGKGKTMLSIFLAEELQQCTAIWRNAVFLEFFCDNKDEKRNTANSIICGLLFQLLKLQPKLSSHITPTFQVQQQSLFAGSSFETLWRIFKNMVCDPVLGSVYCVLDGLDECDETSSELLLRRLKNLFTRPNESSSCRLHLIVVSRDLPDVIPEVLSSFSRIRLDPDADSEVNVDIQRFIDVKIDELSAYRRYPQSLRDKVQKAFQNRAKGTFLWVGIVAQELRRYKATEAEKALDLFPSGLEELYSRMLLQVDTSHREFVAKILRWVVMAVRPLTLSELSAALQADITPSADFNREEIMRDQISYCGYFLTIKEEEVNLLHQSAKEYLLGGSLHSSPDLETFHIDEAKANLDIARTCFQCLQDGGSLILSRESYGITRNWDHSAIPSLFLYAVAYWPVHARSLARSENIFDLSHSFYKKHSPIRQIWLDACKLHSHHHHRPDLNELLHIASCFGILPLAENLLSWEIPLYGVGLSHYVNRKDRRGNTALHFAALNGHEALLLLLLDMGAQRETTNEESETALSLAVLGGHEVIVRILLLEKGAAIQAKDKNGQTALHYAVQTGNHTITQILFDNGAAIDLRNNYRMTALHYAAKMRNNATVQLLLENGAAIEAKDENGETALHYAAQTGLDNTVQLLLDNGAVIDSANEYGETALHFALDSGGEATVQLLLERGANVDSTDMTGKTALHKAAVEGEEAITRLLLEKEANIEAKDNAGKTALHIAASWGSTGSVRLLLEKGANAEAKTNVGRTALEFVDEEDGYASAAEMDEMKTLLQH